MEIIITKNLDRKIQLFQKNEIDSIFGNNCLIIIKHEYC